MNTLKDKLKANKGFTLIEILVVIGIIAILATIVIIAINPARQFAQSRNTQRTANVQAILNAVGQKIADSKGIFNNTTCTTMASANLPSAAQPIHLSGTAANTVNLSCLVPTYISSLPVDPSNPTSPDTGYTILQDANGRITITAPVALTESTLDPDGAGAQTPPAVSITR